MRHWLVMLVALAMCPAANAQLRSESVEYKQGDAVMEGYLAYDPAIQGKQPGVIIVHEWKGLGTYVKLRAEQLARLGYVALAADIYGKNERPKTDDEAMVCVKKYKGDRQLLRARATAALDVLRKQPNVDPKRIAAIGYCFGGTTVLELARSGADLAGVVSFHGALDTPNPGDAKNIECKVLICHGADDPYVPAEQVAAFEKEMREAGVDWELILFGGAVHSFTVPEGGTDNSKGAADSERADKRSWDAMGATDGD